MALIYVIAFLISGALLYKFVVSPELERYRMVRSEFNSQQQVSLRKLNQRDALFSEYQRLRTKADSAQKLLFSRDEAENFLQMLPKLSKQTRNILTSIVPKDSRSVSPQKPKDAKDSQQDAELSLTLAEIEEMPVEVTIRGGYSEIISLFETLESFKQLMAISEVGVTTAREENNKVDTKFLLNLIHTKSAIKAPPDELLAYVETMDQVAEAPEPVKEAAKQTPSERPGTETNRQGPDESEGTAGYSVQVGAFNFEENSKAFARLLKSRNYEPWVRPNLTGKSTHHVLVGKFRTAKEADEFGRLMQRELPWVDEYIVKRTVSVGESALR